MNEKALSLLEIIIAAVILSITMVGLTNLFISGKRLGLHSQYRMSSAEIGKYFLDPLQKFVRQDQWGSNCLSRNGTNPSGCDTTPWKDPSSQIEYTPTYVISSLGSTNLRKVNMLIRWNERAP